MAVKELALLTTSLLKLIAKIYLGCSLVGWLGGMLAAFLIYGTDQIYPYQVVSLVTSFLLFPVVVCYLAILGIEFNIREKRDG